MSIAVTSDVRKVNRQHWTPRATQPTMISSESSDEEFETLHKQQVEPRKKRRVEVSKPVKKPEELAQVAAETHANDDDKELVDAYTVLPEMSREEKKAIRKKRRLDKRDELAKEMDEKTQRETEHERQLKGRAYTLSIAVPGSIVENAQTKELKSYLAGQIARAASIYQVDEIVIFDDQLGSTRGEGDKKRANDPHVFMMRILQYLETPQYLRRALFPMHADLSCAGLLNPLDCPHHLRSDEWSVYREGVVVDRPLKEKEGSHVNVGLQKEVVVDKRIQPGIRVTVKIDEMTKDYKKKMMGKLVSSAEPREQVGVYWGYTARYASSLNNVFAECPYKEGYDLKIGTSNNSTTSVDDDGFRLPRHRHALIMFGGLAGIEECVNADETVPLSGEDAASLFDEWVRTCPTDGSRSIRSEEAVLMSLATLRKPLTNSNRKAA